MDIANYIIFGVIIGIILAFYIFKFFRRWKLRKRMQKAKKGEYKAIKFMKSQGFRVTDLQKEGSYTLFIDDKPHVVNVKADMIVKKGKKTYVAEVKTGDKVTSPKYTDTRRQLLEYYMVYQPSGLLLVDMEKQKVRKVEYSILKYNRTVFINRLMWFVVIFIFGFIVGFLNRGG